MVSGFGFQIGLTEIVIGLAVIALAGVGIWKLAQFLWTASG
jgi:multisubunit Na+/H+ antiporter MnhC subunit